MSERELPAAFGRYRTVALLGTGAMGSVYQAHDPLIDRMVAVKVVRTDLFDQEMQAEFLDRFRREVRAAGRCLHPAIVGVFDYFSDDERPCIVMELIEGRTLQQILRDPASRPGFAHRPILTQVLAGLGYAHAQGITHRDIKPANIMVTEAGQAKIADFGIARFSEATLTQSGLMLGTPSYMAPEQVAGIAVDYRADLFAAGAILYEMLVGEPPFAGRNMTETLLRLTGPEPPSMRAVTAAAGAAYVTLLERALAKRPEQRFQSAEAFAAALAAAGPARPDSTPAGCHDSTDYRTSAGAQATRVLTSGPSDASIGSWNRSVLQRVERALAPYVGPMARVMVTEAARQSATAEELYRELARGLQSATDRSAFLRSLGGGRVEPDLTTARRQQTTTAPQSTSLSIGAGSASPPITIPIDAIEAAQTVLAFFVGPIARMLVRQAAAEASSRQDFLDRVAAHVTKPDEVAALRRRLRAEVTPRLG
jgi:serine/threonine-protein kinase